MLLLLLILFLHPITAVFLFSYYFFANKINISQTAYREMYEHILTTGTINFSLLHFLLSLHKSILKINLRIIMKLFILCENSPTGLRVHQFRRMTNSIWWEFYMEIEMIFLYLSIFKSRKNILEPHQIFVIYIYIYIQKVL